MTGPKVLIIGAGLGGLTLAQALRSKNIEFEIFERDQNKGSRNQGWVIGLHWILPELRLIIPASAPPLESVSVSYGTDGPDEITFYNAYTKEVQARGGIGQNGQFIRANRSRLRALLSTDLNVQWGKRFVRHKVSDDGSVTAFFEDGSLSQGHILVGADGVQSPVRNSLFSSAPPALKVLPVGNIVGELYLSHEQYSRQIALVRSFYIVNANGFRFFVTLKNLSPDFSSGHYYWLLSWTDEGATKPGFWMEMASKEEQLNYVKEKVKDLHPDLREVLEYQEAENIVQPFIIRDCIPTLCPDGPVTLLGDAAHSMSFFRGEGANHAMLDAIQLSRQIASHLSESPTTSPSDALCAYEQNMLPRVTKAVLESREAASNMELSIPDSVAAEAS